METFKVYIIQNIFSPEKAYVGMTKNDGGLFEKYYGSDKDLKKDIKILGKHNFSKTIIGTFNTWQECHYWEGFYVRTLKTHISQGGYNKDWYGGWYRPMTDKIKEKISKGLKGDKNPSRIYGPWNMGKKGIYSGETREKMRNSRLGKKDSNETKQKKIVKLIGRPVSDETRRKIRNGNLGKIRSEETCKRIGLSKKGKQTWMKGKKHTEESRKIISHNTKIGMAKAKKLRLLNEC